MHNTKQCEQSWRFIKAIFETGLRPPSSCLLYLTFEKATSSSVPRGVLFYAAELLLSYVVHEARRGICCCLHIFPHFSHEPIHNLTGKMRQDGKGFSSLRMYGTTMLPLCSFVGTACIACRYSIIRPLCAPKTESVRQIPRVGATFSALWVSALLGDHSRT